MVRIDRTLGAAGTGTTKSSGKKRAGKGKSASASGQVSVGDAASLREKAKVLLADMPDVRLDRIEAIRGALEQGNYQMDEKQLAAHIVANALAEQPW